MSYLSDQLVQSITKITSFMSDKISRMQCIIGLDAVGTIEKNNERLTGQLLSLDRQEQVPEVLIGFNINKVIDRAKSSIASTKLFASDAAKFISTTSSLISFLNTDAIKLHSNLVLFSQVIKDATKKNKYSQYSINYKHMQEATDTVIDSLSSLILKSIEKAEDFNILKEKSKKLVDSIISFVGLYNSISHLFKHTTSIDENLENLDIQPIDYKQQLIRILELIRANKDIVDKYIYTTSMCINSLHMIKNEEIKKYLDEISKNNNLTCATLCSYQPSYNWSFIFNLANSKNINLDDPYAMFLMTKIRNLEINEEDLRFKILKMPALIERHRELITKYNKDIQDAYEKNNKQMLALYHTINEIQKKESIKSQTLSMILKSKSSLKVIFNDLLSGSSIISAVYNNIIRKISDISSENTIVRMLKHLVNAFFTFMKTIFNIFFVIFDVLFKVLSQILFAIISALSYVLRFIFSISFSLFMLTLVPLANLKVYIIYIIQYLIMLSKYFHSFIFVFNYSK